MNIEHVLPALLIRRIGWWVIHFAWQGALIALLTGVLLALLRKADARIRYIVSCIALFATVLLPLVTIFLENPLPFPTANLLQMEQPGVVDVQDVLTNDVVTSRQFRSNAIPTPFTTQMILFCEGHLFQITIIWVAGVFLVSFYRLFGFFQLYLIMKSVIEPIDALWEKQIRGWIQGMNIRQKVRILLSEQIETPAVYGWIKPVLLIPVSFFTGMDAKSVESIIIHELAHIRRYDYLINMIQVMIEALGFFHPAVWWLSNRVRKEREDCCDDWSVRVLGDKLIYVKSLVRLEETRHLPRPVMAANGSELSRRVMRILDYPHSRQPSSVIYTFVFSLCIASFILFSGFRFSEKRTVAETENLKSHLVAYYPFTGNALDRSGSEKHGEVKNAVLTKDRFGRQDQAYSFNGKNALIGVKGGGRLFFDGSVTVSCWINPQKIIPYASWVSMAFAQATRSQWRLGFGSGKNSEWGLTETVVDQQSKIWTDYWITHSEIPLNRWSHITMVINQESDEVIMYQNGRRIGRIDQLEPYIRDKNLLYIGYQADNPAFFLGSIDEVRIYDIALDDDEIYTIYKMN